nr:universal stress protein [uncultured Dyadobacter sp.]
MKKILVPFYFSPETMHAYWFALDIAAANEGEVIVLKVADLTPGDIKTHCANATDSIHVAVAEKSSQLVARVFPVRKKNVLLVFIGVAIRSG